MKQPEWVQAGVLAGKKYHFQTKNPWKHNALNLSLFVLALLAFAVTLYGSKVITPWIYVPAASFIFGLLYFFLFILVVHEGSHNMFVIAKDPKRSLPWNNFFGSVICVPFAMNYQKHWEEGHRIHHVRPLESDDAQACVQRTGTALFKECAKLLIPGYFQLIGSFKGAGNEYHCPQVEKYPTSHLRILGSLAFWALVFTIGVHYFTWAAPLAAFLGCQVVGLFNLFKQAMEHGGDIGYEKIRAFRSLTSLFPLRRVLMPLNISFHFEHHLNFCVPWYDLLKYHEDLKSIMPKELQSHFFNRDVWGQILGKKHDLARDARPVLKYT